MGLADDISDGIKDVAVALRYIILIAIAIIILLAFAGVYSNNQEIIDQSVDDYKELVEDQAPVVADSLVNLSVELCSQQYMIDDIKDKIKSIPHQVVASYNTNSDKDENVQRLLRNYQWGIELTDMEFLTIADDIDKHHKIKYGFKDLQTLCKIQQFLK